MTDAELAEGLAWADVLCPTVTDSVSAELLGAPNVRARLLANFGVGFQSYRHGGSENRWHTGYEYSGCAYRCHCGNRHDFAVELCPTGW